MSGEMREISSTEFQREIGAVVDHVASGKGPVTVNVHGRRRVVLVRPDEYDALCEARRQLAWERLSRHFSLDESGSGQSR